jgi:hypothetical protein
MNVASMAVLLWIELLVGNHASTRKYYVRRGEGTLVAEIRRRRVSSVLLVLIHTKHENDFGSCSVNMRRCYVHSLWLINGCSCFFWSLVQRERERGSWVKHLAGRWYVDLQQYQTSDSGMKMLVESVVLTAKFISEEHIGVVWWELMFYSPYRSSGNSRSTPACSVVHQYVFICYLHRC